MINKKIKIKTQSKTILLNSLFKSKNYYGEYLNKTKKELLPFIYGIRHKYSIINLKYTIIFLIRIIKLIKNLLKHNQKILIIGNSIDIKFLLNKNLIKKNNNIIFFNKKWINGLITNKTILNNFLKKNNINLIFLIKTSSNNNFLLKEIYNIKIPIISFLNTNQNIKYINYPIITNNKNIKSLFFLIYLIRKII